MVFRRILTVVFCNDLFSISSGSASQLMEMYLALA